MNNCPKCGSLLFPGDTVCKTCGEPVSNINPTSGVASMESPFIPEIAPSIPEINVASVPVGESPVEQISEIPGVPSTPVESFQPMGAVETPTQPVSDIPGVPSTPIVPEVPSVSPVGVREAAHTPVPVPTAQPVPPLPEMKVPKPNDSLEKEAKINRILFMSVLGVTAVAIFVMGFFMIKMFSGNNDAETLDIASNALEYHYEGFTLYISEDLYAEVYENEFYVGATDASWSAVMTLESGTYNTLVSNKQQLVDYFRDMGYEASDPVEKEVSGTAFVTTEVMMGTKNVLVAYSKANGTNLFGIILENETGEYTDESLKPIGTILSTMKYVGPYFELPDGFHLDLFKNTFTIAE